MNAKSDDAPVQFPPGGVRTIVDPPLRELLEAPFTFSGLRIMTWLFDGANDVRALRRLILEETTQGERRWHVLERTGGGMSYEIWKGNPPEQQFTARTATAAITALSPRQVEVLRMLADGERSSAIAARLHLSVKTVESHRSEIMKRLGIHSAVGLARYAVRVGLVDNEGPQKS